MRFLPSHILKGGMMKKLILIVAVSIFLLTSCSNELNYGPRAEVRLTFDKDNLESIMGEFDTILLVKNIKYKNTVLKKGALVPRTFYTLEDFDVIKSKKRPKENMIGIQGGIVTKKEFYEKTGDIPKPSKEEENVKIKEYLTYYFEFEENTEYIVFANASDKYYTNAYTIFEKSKLSNTYKNKFTGLKIDLNQLK